MKRIFLNIIAFVCMACFLLAGCDKIEGDFYQIVQNEDVTVTFPDINPDEVYRKILVEEFTGHRCTNCPQGHQTLESLHQQYGDTLVTVGIHYGALAKPFGSMFSYDFRTEVGNQIGDAFSIDGIPAAIVNRVDKNGGWPREQWASVLRDVDRSKVSAAVQLINEYDVASKTLKANVKVTTLKAIDHQLRLILFVVEDDIVKPQKDGNQDIENYVHNHVLRCALTDAFGFVLTNGSWNPGDSETYAASISFDGHDWIPENCQVVAALLDPITSEVLQVEKAKVVNR
ncbi:MAG: Omp28 family outer membrane lipoprotein [Bacteroidales bacterium]|nr:Omp28 family outer membrane lipoprotein [Bacteroidales bacterium]